MATALEKIKSYRDRQKNPIKYIDINESSPLEKIKAYKKANPKSTPVNLDKIREQQNQPMITPVDIQSNTIKLPTAQTILPVEQKKQSSATELPVYELNKPSQNGIYSVPQRETVARGWEGLDISKILKVPENFKDGYQFGDITKTAGSTILDLGTSTTKGIFNLGEGIGDLAQYGVAQVGDWLGADDFADQL